MAPEYCSTGDRTVSLKVPLTHCHRPTGRTTGQPGRWCVR